MKSWEEKSWFSRKLFRSKPIDPIDHAHELRSVLEELGDAFIRAKKGQTAKRVAVLLASKIGAMTLVSSSFLGLASLFGTASTGTAISTLSGAAFTNSALAWLGGSVVAGSAIITGVSVVGGIAAYLGLKKLGLFQGRDRDIEGLPIDEKLIYEAIVALVEKLNRKDLISGPTLLSFWNFNLEPMLEKLDVLASQRFLDWKPRDLKRLHRALNKIRKLRERIEYKLSKTAVVGISAFSASITKLALEVGKYDQQDWLVIQALRRSTKDLGDDASPEDIGAYLRQHDDLDAKQGILNNAKGIYHELAYAHRENNDGDVWFVELSAKTNQPGIDIWLINDLTQERFPYQLKATDSRQTVNEHENNYDIPILGTEEIASKDNRVEDSGFSNEDLTTQTKLTIEKLEVEGTFAQVGGDSLLAASVAAAISFSVSLGASLKSGEPISDLALDSLKPAREAFILGAALTLFTEFTL